MSVRDTVQELTQIGTELRRNLESLPDKTEKEALILRHIKVFSNKASRIADFQTARGTFMPRSQRSQISREQNTGNIAGVTVAKPNRTMRLNNKENCLLADKQIREYVELTERGKVLDQELYSLQIEERELRSNQETVDLLHKYNDIREATETVIQTIAVTNRSIVRDVYEKYSLSWEQD